MKEKLVQTGIRIPSELKKELQELADREHWTFNQAIIESIKMMIKNS